MIPLLAELRRAETKPQRLHSFWKSLPLPLKRAAILLGKALLLAHLGLFLAILVFSLLYSFLNPPATSLMLYRRLFNNQKLRPVKFVPLSRIPRSVRQMLIKVEDYKFYEHAGIDLQAIKDAWEVNRAIGYNLYGGSTLTQQLARTLFLYPRKTYLRKYLEALVALEMDLVMKKDRILELYFNYAEWGRGVFGLGAAATYYYRKGLSALTADEYMRMIAILSSPMRYNVNNFQKSRLLAERYRYLSSRFGPPAPPAPPEAVQTPSPASQSPESPAEEAKPLPVS